MQAGFMSPTEECVLNYLYETLEECCPAAFDLSDVVYLKSTPAICAKRIAYRDRPEEREVV